MRRWNQETRARRVSLSVLGHLLPRSPDVTVEGGGRPGLDRWHGTLYGDDAGTDTQHGGPQGRRQGQDCDGGREEGGGMRAQSHLKGRRGVQLKLLIRELRKATRSETKGAR